MANPASLPYSAQAKQFTTVQSLTPTNVPALNHSVQSFTVTGLDPIAHSYAKVTQFAWSSGSQTQTSGIIVLSAFVSAANTLKIVFFNSTGGDLTPAAGYYGIAVD